MSRPPAAAARRRVRALSLISAVRRPKARLAVTEGESVLREWQQRLIDAHPTK